MQLEEYFDFLAPNDIRIKGHRIGIESVLYEFIHRSRTPEEIVTTYPTLTLEVVYATILYYLHYKEQVSNYMAEWVEWAIRVREEQAKDHSPVMERLRKAKREKIAAERAEGGYETT